MTTYSEWTQQLGDAWVAALKRAEDTLVSVSSTVRESTAKVDLPTVEVPEQLTKLNDAVSEKLPKPSEIVEANFELTNRLLAAQRELTLKLIEASTPVATKS